MTAPHNTWPADKVERWPLDKLIPYARNARTHSPEQVAQIAASMREWGWTNPVLVAEDGMIIAGHGRVSAARSLGLAEAPVMVAVGWSEAQKRAYVLADNKLALNAGWDIAALANELRDLDTGELDLSLIGFSEEELAALLAPVGTPGLTDPDAAPDVAETPVSVLGDVWLLGGHRVLCGDATDALLVERLLGEEKPNLMVTDPPYGVEYDADWRNHTGMARAERAIGKVENDQRADWRDAFALYLGAVAYVWHAGKFASTVQASLEACNFEIRCQIIWAKNNFAISRGDYHWKHEPCWYAVRKGSTGNWCGDRSQTTLWEIDKPQKSETGHSTQKPVECMRRPIENSSNPGDVVYEPFCGSGTTIIACEQTSRRCLAVEISPTYVDMAVKRWQAFTGKSATLEGSGETFDAVAADRLKAAA